MKPLKTEPELFDLFNQLKIWAIDMYHITATKEQKKYDPIELIIRFQWDNIHVNHEKPEYYDNITMKLPKSHILFSTTFKNNTDTEQEYNFRTERCTRSIAEIEIQKGVLLSNELSIKLSVKIEEEEMNCCFRLRTTMYGRLRVLFLDPIHDNVLIKYLEGDLGTIIQERLKSDRSRENGLDTGPNVWTESMPKSNQRIFYMETIGKCKFRFGVHQFVEVNQKAY
ncbi:LIN 24 Twenty four Like family member [Schistosoma japonicum]|uniref:LIN 24 Twenty four Like family member n=1 Tax=Schistosoma japonicum TaxID=6182 RepID=A0A4Z2DIE9_SCHJA|nr:LIN 24 Twenty four Like family member [Schistosoma japonicum]